MRRFSRARIVWLAALLCLLPRVSAADELRIMTSGTFTAAFLQLAPRFERATGHHAIAVTTTIGVGANSIPNRLQRREPADVVILDDETMATLVASGAVTPSSRTPVARSGIGMAVRAGAPRPDISTLDALRRTLLRATSVAYSASVSGRYVATELYERLGIAGEMTPKSRRIEGERVGAVVARGEAEIGFQQTSELLPVPGIDYVGPLPAEVQRVSVFSAAVTAYSMHPEAAAALIRFLASTDAAPAVLKSGLEPSAR